MLDLDILEFPGYYEFVSFLEMFLDFSKELCIYKFKLAFVRNKLDPAYMTQLIHNAIMRRVQHLDLSCYMSYLVETLMHLSVYTCETLVNLKLCSVSLADFEYVSLPRLKIMHLENSIYTSDALLEKLISSCPVLEDVEAVNNVATDNTSKVLRVRSQSLKSLIFYCNGHTVGTYDREVVIDAPGLKYLSLTDYQSRSFVISNLSSSAKVHIDVNFYMVKNSAESAFSKRSVVRKFFTGLSGVRDMTIRDI